MHYSNRFGKPLQNANLGTAGWVMGHMVPGTRPMAQWSAEAWKRVAHRDTMMRRMFERTGCHLARVPGALDRLVKLEQLTEEQHQ